MTIKIDHVNLTVANIDMTIEWYKKVFGFKLVESGVKPFGARWGIIAVNDFMICMMEFPDRLPADKADSKSAHHIYHFGIRVDDVEKWQKIVKDLDLRVLYGGQVSYPNSTSWYIQDPSGHEIEVNYCGQSHLKFPEGDNGNTKHKL